MREFQSFLVDGLEQGKRALIIESLEIAEAKVVGERERTLDVESGIVGELVATVGSRQRVAAVAEAVASACAAAGMRTPRVILSASPDRLSLDFGSIVLTIENEHVSLGSTPALDPTPTKEYVLHEADRVFADSEKASRWLRRPSQVLGGRTPLSMLDSEPGAREVAEELGRIDHGIFS